MNNNIKRIRNFAIVAHVDHGKSTLCDRLLEKTGTVEKRAMVDQYLDSNPIERERGITIKLAPVRLKYKFKNEDYILNLIDTPGHVDFSYEVSRSLAACEGILLVVDATQGIQAQTLAHMELIKNRNLTVIPLINKIDLTGAKVQDTRNALKTTFNFKDEEIIEISAKEDINIDKVLEEIVKRIPSPQESSGSFLQAMVFTSQFDPHKGVIVYIKVISGEISLEKRNLAAKSQNFYLKLIASNTSFNPLDIGIFIPKMSTLSKLSCGEVGYLSTGLKDISLANVGDTITSYVNPAPALSGYAQAKPMVFLSIYPINNDEFSILKVSLDKLHLCDSSFSYKPYSSIAIGKGFLCGFLGLLHSDVIVERLEKEFGISVITTTPTVEYQLMLNDGTTLYIHSTDEYPAPEMIKSVKEPVMMTTIYAPIQFVGQIIQLCEDKRGKQIDLEYFIDKVKFTYCVPLSEMLVNFFDNLKTVSEGYASLDYELYDYQEVEVAKVDILINKTLIPAFSSLIIKDKTTVSANSLVNKLRDLIPRHQFEIPIQAVIGGKIIARSDIKSFRKDVTKKLYGGDQTRKDKLLDAQKKGKKRMKAFGRVNIPQEVFLNLYK